MPILLSQLVPSVSSKSAQFLFFSAAALDALPPLAAEKMLGACEAGTEGGIRAPASGTRGTGEPTPAVLGIVGIGVADGIACAATCLGVSDLSTSGETTRVLAVSAAEFSTRAVAATSGPCTPPDRLSSFSSALSSAFSSPTIRAVVRPSSARSDRISSRSASAVLFASPERTNAITGSNKTAPITSSPMK